MKHILNFNDYLNESSKNPLDLKKGDENETRLEEAISKSDYYKKEKNVKVLDSFKYKNNYGEGEIRIEEYKDGYFRTIHDTNGEISLISQSDDINEPQKAFDEHKLLYKKYLIESNDNVLSNFKAVDEGVDMAELEDTLKRIKKENPGKKVGYAFFKDAPKGYRISIDGKYISES
jgi:hypothetical protein